jgi:hypothetical protein
LSACAFAIGAPFPYVWNTWLSAVPFAAMSRARVM